MRLKKSMADINSKIADVKSNLQMLQQGLVAMNGQKGRSLRTEVEDCLASVTFIQLKFAIWDAFVYEIFEDLRPNGPQNQLRCQILFQIHLL